MPTFIELNDTLRISKAQGFPLELDIAKHLKVPFVTADFKDKVYSFYSKKEIRVYKVPPVRNFLVEDIDGKWLYWGLVHITEIHHDYIKRETSGKFVIIHLNSPEEMRQAYNLIDRNPDNNFFAL